MQLFDFYSFHPLLGPTSLLPLLKRASLSLHPSGFLIPPTALLKLPWQSSPSEVFGCLRHHRLPFKGHQVTVIGPPSVIFVSAVCTEIP